jgi:hypothetical protein
MSIQFGAMFLLVVAVVVAWLCLVQRGGFDD